MNSSLSISALTARNENTLALAAVNFNFSLVTLEPPMEYKKLGQHLSLKRRTAAEEGSIHITARKLGALFEQVAKPSDALIKAYGVRSSEISASPEANPTGSDQHGFLRDQVGADGTTIWAAATSGKSAIAMNLLACFLARIWSQPEAISIWIELVEHRKREIMKDMDGSEPAHLAPMEAARQPIKREELAEWDAGARAWLQAGDVAKKREMKQLSLIINNINLPVDNSPQLYTSVIRAWKTAMDTVGKLITGMSHRVQNGAVLLALSAWHIYPDMVVLSDTEKYVSQRDPLILSHAYVTIGFQNTPGSDEDGVNWSLSLARLRYYGPPVPSKRSTGESERLAFPQFLFVFLGTFLAGWQDVTTDLLLAAELITTIWESISQEAASTNSCAERAKHLVDPSTWISLLYQAARALLDSTGTDREEAMRLVKTGLRPTCSNFLNDRYESTKPAFGLTELATYLTVLREEERVLALENATSANGDVNMNFDKRERNRVPDNPDAQAPGSLTSYLYKVIPKLHMKLSGRHPSTERNSVHFPKPTEGGGSSSLIYHEHSRAEITKEYAINYGLVDKYGLADHRLTISDVIMAIKFDSKNSRKVNTERLLDHVAWNYIDPDTWSLSTKNFVSSLQAVAAAAMVYKLLPNATISIQIFQSPLYRAKWIRKHSDENKHLIFHPYRLTRGAAFACVAMFETGSLDLNGRTLNIVMAMSIGDSIYVSAPLLSDPSETTEEYELKRVVGNIGRAGVALMIPPINPQMKKRTLGNWRQINHHDYDGKAQDSFQSTSLHLSFTGYDQPVMGAESHGAQDVEACFVEAVVSVMDRGQWVGDLDVLEMRESVYERLRHLEPCTDRDHLPPTMPSFKVCSIDLWDELLDKPQHIPGVVRATGNWLARLAATTLSVQSSHKTFLVPKGCEPCWKCYESIQASNVSDNSNSFVENGSNVFGSSNSFVKNGTIVIY